MGKKQKEVLGRSLMKDKSVKINMSKTSLLHTSELQDGRDFNRINFKSITEETDVDSFLSTAELAGTDFKAEKLNVKFVRPCTMVGILTTEERKKIKSIQESNKTFLRIPRRPPWDRSMSADELAQAERDSFLEWRRSLSELQEKEGIIMTPFEKNLQFWRQLWRVIERSDVVVQIVDARNPLLFRCEDLVDYVKEVDVHKQNLLLVNKADFLTEEQRKTWAKYFNEANIKAVFYSATLETDDDDADSEVDNDHPSQASTNEEPDDDLRGLRISDGDKSENICENLELSIRECQSDLDHLLQSHKSTIQTADEGNENSACPSEENFVHLNYINSSTLLNRKELIEVFKNFHVGPKLHRSRVTIGLVGYPNVGKSSSINSLLQEKKTAVSATPGKTKHFQTLFLSNDLLLCDCPGLVFPAFVTTKQDMILSGILPIDQMKDHVPAVNLLLSIIPRNTLEAKYGVNIPLPLEGEDPQRNPISEEFLSVYGYMRGYMSSRGIPDHPRSARPILKDYVNGKLLYCHCPPEHSQENYHEFFVDKVRKIPLQPTPHQCSALPRRNHSAVVDASFFDQNPTGLHYRGRQNLKLQAVAAASVAPSDEPTVSKPWRLISKRNTRQKSRIKFAHLDK